MKRLIPIILSILALTLSISVRAQSFEEQLNIAESIKTQYGETDDRYLDALSKAIQAAFSEQKNEEANKYRLIHADIVKGKYGENSLEYAEDMWRLGNVSEYKGEQYRFDCYKKAQRILETLNAKDSFIYSDLFWQFFRHYWDEKEWLLSTINMQKYIEYAKPWINKEWKGNVLGDRALAYAYYLLGLTYFSRLNNYSSAIEAYKECVSIVEEHQLLHEFPNALVAYQDIWQGYENLNDHKASLEWRLKCVSATKDLKGDTSEEYLGELSSLRYCYYALNDYESAKKTNLTLLAQIEKRDTQAGINCETDSLYLEEYQNIVKLGIVFKKYPDAILYGSRLSDIYKARGEENSETYLSLLYDLILVIHNTNDFITEYSLFPQYESLAKNLNLTETKEYYDYLDLKAEALVFLYRQDEYAQVLSQRNELMTKLFGEYSTQRILQEFSIANQLESLDKRNDAISHLQKCYDIIESGKCVFEYDSQKLLFMAGLHNLEGQIYTWTDPDRAEAVLKKAIEESLLLEESAFAPFCNLGVLYSSVRHNPRLAVDSFVKAKGELEKIGDNQSINYITVLNNIGVCYQELGLSSYAISIFDRAQGTVEHVYGKSHPMYATILQHKSLFYAHITDYALAIKTGEEARACMGSIYGLDSEKYGMCTQNLGFLYQNVNQYDKAKELLLEALNIFKTLNSPHLINTYTNLLTCYAHDGDLDSFDEIYHKGDELIVSNNWQNTEIDGNFTGAVGYCLLSKGNLEGKKLIGYSLKVLEDTGKKGSLEYFAKLLLYYMAAIYDGTSSESDIPFLYSVYKNLYLNNVAFYNASERASFVTSPWYAQIKDILFAARKGGEYDTTLYDYLLFSKGLLLGTSLNYAKAVYNSGNDEVVNYYSQYQKLERFINGENVIIEGNPTINEAKEQASVLERQITHFLRQNGGYTDGLSYTYSDVCNSLGASEAAIEFVTFKDYSDNTEYAAALIAKKELSAPIYVKLCKKEEIERVASLSPDRLYGESVASENAYNLVWAPLIPHLENIKTVYFSPAGIINKMAIEHLFNGEKRFDEEYDVNRLTSTREICINQPQYKYASAVLYGGLKYDEDDATMIAESRNSRGTSTTQPSVFRSFDGSITRKGWEYLPGTLEEVNKISSIISKNQINCDVYTSTKGNEESFKALSGNDFGLLHIATHGFYMSESHAERNDFFASNPFTSRNAESEFSALQRSGLLLAGANKAWKGEVVPEGVEDGILTAAEIAYLDLNRCDVVVLSACETGLGEITDEGVFGLQRAFKNAGVNTIIMSLWEVDDQATSLMMQTFYRNLVRGKSKRESFTAAQAEVRKKYSDPRYWAAFIMLD